MILFKSLWYKNFLSTGNSPTTINLNAHRATLVYGKNGSGKSTMLDALSFVLFNKAFRNINKPLLVNSINNSDCSVMVDFEVSGVAYRVVRGVKPNIFEIYKNGALIQQNASSKDYQDILEKTILKMNHKTFCQIVVLGTAGWSSFMDLPPADRRKVVEDLMDIEVFSHMNVLLKSYITDNKKAIDTKKHAMDRLDAIIETNEKNRLREEERKKNDITTIDAEIASCEETISRINDNISAVNTKLDSLKLDLIEFDSVYDDLRENRSMADDVRKNIANAKKIVDFYQNADTCPQCKQAIDDDHKESILNKALSRIKIDEQKLVEIQEEIEALKIQIEREQAIRPKINAMEVFISTANTKKQIADSQVEQLKKQRADYQNNSVTPDSQKEILEKQAIKDELEVLKKDAEIHKVAAVLLKDDGIKTKIINQYLKIINKKVNEYLQKMDFFVLYTLDETFTEVIKAQHKDKYTYNSFSQGEKMRIDLALLFTWRELAKMRNSGSSNLLILDEFMDSSLDAEGTDEFMDIIFSLTGEQNTFIISHKIDQISDKFDHMLVVTKKKNFSKVDHI